MRQRAGAIVFAVAAMTGTVLLSAVVWSPAEAGKAIIRLSWRATGARVEECRAPTDEENARLPAHMRREEICEGRSTPFLLSVSIDGRDVVHDTLQAAGARGDRPVYVLRQIETEPGARNVSVTFDMLLPVAVEPPEPGTGGFPAHLRLESRVRMTTGQVSLITYDSERRLLVVRP